MSEETLKKYFQDELSVDQLVGDLAFSQERRNSDVTWIHIQSAKSIDDFKIKKDHLIKLCDDFLKKKLTPTDIATVSFALLCSDYFFWDSDTTEGKLVAKVILDWDTSNIGFELSTENIKLWRNYLLTGNYHLV